MKPKRTPKSGLVVANELILVSHLIVALALATSPGDRNAPHSALQWAQQTRPTIQRNALQTSSLNGKGRSDVALDPAYGFAELPFAVGQLSVVGKSGAQLAHRHNSRQQASSGQLHRPNQFGAATGAQVRQAFDGRRFGRSMQLRSSDRKYYGARL